MSANSIVHYTEKHMEVIGTASIGIAMEEGLSVNVLKMIMDTVTILIGFITGGSRIEHRK